MAKFKTKFQHVLQQALRRDDFARKLLEMSEAAARAGVGSPEWEALTREFSDDPQELAQMKNPRNRRTGIDTRITTILLGTHSIDTLFTTFLTTLGLGIPPTASPQTGGPKASKRASKSRAGKRGSTKKAGR